MAYIRGNATFVHTRGTGDIGEDIACIFLKNKGFTITERNFRRPYGELDIIAEKDGFFHFFEVKSVRIMSLGDHTPEENVHANKIRHIRRMVQAYLECANRGMTADFQFHVLSVYMDVARRRARVKWLRNLIL